MVYTCILHIMVYILHIIIIYTCTYYVLHIYLPVQVFELKVLSALALRREIPREKIEMFLGVCVCVCVCVCTCMCVCVCVSLCARVKPLPLNCQTPSPKHGYAHFVSQ